MKKVTWWGYCGTHKEKGKSLAEDTSPRLQVGEKLSFLSSERRKPLSLSHLEREREREKEIFLNRNLPSFAMGMTCPP